MIRADFLLRHGFAMERSEVAVLEASAVPERVCDENTRELLLFWPDRLRQRQLELFAGPLAVLAASTYVAVVTTARSRLLPAGCRRKRFASMNDLRRYDTVAQRISDP